MKRHMLELLGWMLVPVVFGLGLWLGREITITRYEAALEELTASCKDSMLHAGHARQVVAKVTAYSNDPISINVPRWRDGFTATMTRARVGVCATDWDVFPPRTVLHVEGYGLCVVEDRGGLVRGLHVDVFVPSYQEARLWGVRSGTVTVLERGN